MNPVSDMGAAGFLLFWGLTALAAGIFIVRGYQLVQYIYLGRNVGESKLTLGKMLGAIWHLILQQCQFKSIRRKDWAGLGHSFMVWGFLCFVIYYLLFIVIASGFGISAAMENNAFYVIWCWVTDIIAPFIVIGVIWAVIRRYIGKPARLKGQLTWEAIFILMTVLIHPITHVGKIATQIAAEHAPAGLGLATPPISTLFSNLYTASASLEASHAFWFWSHWVFVLLVMAIIGYTRYLHVVAAIINDVLQPKTKNMVERIDLKDRATFGVSRVDGFSRKQLLDVYACVVCGYCQENCPANLTDKPLNPRLVINDIKTNLMTNGPALLKKQSPSLDLVGDGGEGTISEDALWACTTCGACMEVCPVYIEHVPKIVDMRRELVQVQAKFPEELLNLFENTEQRSNPWGIAPSDRAKWAANIDAQPFEEGKTEYLFYVGCAGAFDSRERQVSLAITRVLDAAGISWGILGRDEACCGDSLRRLGNEYVYDQLVKQNLAMFKERGVKKIITECPHCYTTLKNDYRQYGAELDVVHHTELINRLLTEGRLKLNGTGGDLGNVVFHDSCYLGRHNDVYEAPRQALAAATGRVPTEMERHHNRAFCCGAGGGRMWMEESTGKRINIVRVEEALEKDPKTICVCCPYCMVMFEDGLKDMDADDRVQVLDLAEIVAARLK
ncbi:MAG: 4Fe-4S dicluster domain-containing protein [Dehalococcoidales bacterium]|nr:4Fe-4S dicluster domain-containing protein [Dehalococcoidales bacterium]